MLGEAEIQTLNAGLQSVKESDRRHRDDLHELLGQFRLLLDSYNGLRSNYDKKDEELRQYKAFDHFENRQTGKTNEVKSEVTSESRNPFVLVLVDGDGYLFQDHFIKDGEQGGKQAAHLLWDYITEYVRELLGASGSDCDIMVRIYSNVLSLSKTLGRAGLVGREARSLSTFASSFTETHGLFDYIDTAESSGRPFQKIKENLRLFGESEQCKHIFFAACNDTKYLPLLAPYRGRRDRMTLIKAASFDEDFGSLGLPVRELRSLFTSEPVSEDMALSQTIIISPPATPGPSVCRFYPKGNCRYGDKCKNIHTMPRGWSSTSENSFSRSISSQTKYSTATTRGETDYATLLPSPTFITDTIPVNKYGDRLDPYSPIPPASEWEPYFHQVKQKKLCNRHYLAGDCTAENCWFDHDSLSFDPTPGIRYTLRRENCRKGVRCRALDCWYGHHCQKGGCDGKRPCLFDRSGHTLDLNVARWEEPSGSSGSREVDETPIESSADVTSLSLEVSEWQPEPSLMDFDF